MSDIPTPKPQAGDLVFALAFLVAASLLLSELGEQTTWVKRKVLIVQPGFWPALSLGGMVLFGFVYAVGAWRRSAAGSLTEMGVWARSAEFVGWFLAYVFVMPVIGYLVATVLFCIALTLRAGYRSWRWVGIAAATGAAIVVVFKALLQVRIPGGAVYEYLPAAARNFAIVYL